MNLNAGCPSPKVAGSGGFGAALMLEPGRVAEATAAMREALISGGRGPSDAGPEGSSSGTATGGRPVPLVSVKCRTGVDDVDSVRG